jgi:hypothetical protein
MGMPFRKNGTCSRPEEQALSRRDSKTVADVGKHNGDRITLHVRK